MKNPKPKLFLSRITSIIMALTILLFLTVSCKDDEPVDKRILLTSAPWVFSSVSSGDPTVDALATLFFTGFSITFNSDGSYSVVFPIDPTANSTGVWEFNSNETAIITDKGSLDETTWAIKVLDEGSLVLNATEDILGTGTPIAYDISFTH